MWKVTKSRHNTQKRPIQHISAEHLDVVLCFCVYDMWHSLVVVDMEVYEVKICHIIKDCLLTKRCFISI